MRWKADVTYRTDSGPVTVTHNFEELREIDDLVEAGPDWRSLIDIHIEYNGVLKGEHVTVEEAEAL